MVRVKRKLKVRYCKSDAKRQKSIEDEYKDDELEGVVSKFGEAQQHDEFHSLWSQLPLELKERVLQDLPTSSVVQFACTLSTEWHWTFLGGCRIQKAL